MSDEEAVSLAMRYVSLAGQIYQRHDLTWWDSLDTLNKLRNYVNQQIKEERTDEDIIEKVLSLAKHTCSKTCGTRPLYASVSQSRQE